MYILFGAFFTGILASLTPCIYPMIPITVSILQAQATKSFTLNLLRAVVYILGIAFTYATLGYIAATSTVMFGEWVVNPWVVGTIVMLFIYLAFSMFGFYEIYMPKFLTNRTDVSPKGSLLYTFIFGIISGTIASPCLTPALAGLLGYVAKQGNPILGFLTLFMFALGMGSVLLLVGVFSGSVALLPRAGMWMNEIKKIFGFLLLGVTVYFVEPLISADISMILYGAVVVSATVYYLFYFINLMRARR